MTFKYLRIQCYSTIFIVLLFALSTSASLLSDEKLQELIYSDENVKNFYTSHLDKFHPYLERFLNHKSNEIGSDCSESLRSIQKGLLENKLWALEYYDASGKGTAGHLAGYIADFGSYDQCIKLRSSPPNTKKFQGQYCAISFQTKEWEYLINNNALDPIMPKSGKTIQWSHFFLGYIYGTCIPSLCNPKKLFDAFNHEFRKEGFRLQVQENCSIQTSENEPFSFLQILAIVIILIQMSFIIIANFTSYGIFKHYNIRQNTSVLFKKVTKPQEKRLKPFHGIKSFYILISVSAHCWFVFSYIIPFAFGGMKRYEIFSVIIQEFGANSLLFLEMMFFIGAIFTMFSWFPIMEKKKVNIFTYGFYRWIRVMPIVLVNMLLLNLIIRLGHGPFFKDLFEVQIENCENNFWKNFFLVGSTGKVDMCLATTWYLSVDFQLYILHFFSILALARKPILGFLVIFLQIAYSLGTIFYRVYTLQDSPFYRLNEMTAIDEKGFANQYFSTYVHNVSYSIGILIAWRLLKEKPFVFENFMYYPMWIISALATILSIYIPYLFKIGLLKETPLRIAVWAAISRPLFLSLFVYAFYVIYFGKARGLARFFKSDIFLPVSRMSLSIVITQFLYIIYFLGSLRKQQTITTFDQIKESTFGFFCCILIGYLMFILFEAPIFNIVFSMLKFDSKKSEISKKNSETSPVDENGNLISQKDNKKNHSSSTKNILKLSEKYKNEYISSFVEEHKKKCN